MTNFAACPPKSRTGKELFNIVPVRTDDGRLHSVAFRLLTKTKLYVVWLGTSRAYWNLYGKIGVFETHTLKK